MPENQLKNAPKIFKEDCRINLQEDAGYLFNFIRGLSPYPAAYLFFELESNESLQVKIFKVKISDAYDSLAAGAFHSDGKSFLKVGCGAGSLQILELQVQGKKRMSVEEFLRGFNIRKLQSIS